MNQFKRAQVVILPTDKDSNLVFNPITGKLLNIYNSPYSAKEWININTSIIPKHLYILSDEEIKEGDYIYWLSQNKIIQCEDNSMRDRQDLCKKIIATTDTSLFTLTDCPIRGSDSSVKYILPQPSKQFIEKYIEDYNKGNVIKDVLVEYNEEFPIGFSDEKRPMEHFIKKVLKINPKDNTITINKIKKDFNKEDLIKIAKLSYNKALTSVGHSEIEFGKWFDNWIENNL